MRAPIKLLFAVSLLIASGCETMPGADLAAVDATGDPRPEVVAFVEAEALKAEVAKLKAENEKLASRVEELQTRNEKLAVVDKALDAGEDVMAKNEEPALPVRPLITVPSPEKKKTAVVDNAAAPDLKKSDVPVEEAPRMVQPTFASTETVFEDESNGEIATESVLFGVHLASYRQIDAAREGWQKLQRENPDELGLLEPRVETVNIKDRGRFLRLIGGGFSSEEKAAALCASLEQKGDYCAVTSFQGVRLSLSEMN